LKTKKKSLAKMKKLHEKKKKEYNAKKLEFEEIIKRISEEKAQIDL